MLNSSKHDTRNITQMMKMNRNVMVSLRNRKRVSRSMMIKAKNIIMKERIWIPVKLTLGGLILAYCAGRLDTSQMTGESLLVTTRKRKPGSHMKRVIAVQEEPSLHVNSTRERCPGLKADTMETSRGVNLFKKFKTACPRMSRAG